MLEEIRHRNFHIANPGKQEEKPVTAEEPVTEEASGSMETETASKPMDTEEETEENAEPETIEESAKNDTSKEDEDK